MVEEDDKYMVGSFFLVEATREEAQKFTDNDPFKKVCTVPCVRHGSCKQKGDMVAPSLCLETIESMCLDQWYCMESHRTAVNVTSDSRAKQYMNNAVGGVCSPIPQLQRFDNPEAKSYGMILNPQKHTSKHEYM